MMALFGVRVSAGIINEDAVLLEWVSNPLDVLIKGGNVDIHPRRMPCNHEGSDWSDVSMSQHNPKIARKPLEAWREA